jgi:hypothetical protein
MRIETPEDRIKLDARVESALGWEGSETIFSGAAVRAGLAVLRPQTLAARWFRGGQPHLATECTVAFLDCIAAAMKPRQNNAALRLTRKVLLSGAPWPEQDTSLLETVIAEFPKWVETIRPLITRRSDLFAWVYGPSPATSELVYVRLPSRERRFLIGYLRSGLRRRYPWLTTRLIAAMAFRPDAFASLSTAPDGQPDWGPLYRRAVIQKGRKSRYLWIPNPVLKRLQKSLLRLLQPAMDRALGDSVFGARAGLASPTFANAAQHLHRCTIASFDLKDFFPSTTVADVIRGLQHLATASPLAIDPARKSDYEGILLERSHLRWLPWTDDLRVFVARLGTRKGRLPQGSPLSPLLANVAFSPFDERIARELGQVFGAGQVRYTRYFDDLTISLAPGSGGNVGDSRTAFRAKCQAIVTNALAGSSYRLNPRKSRCGGTSSGHRVTGLVVRKDRVSLPRAHSRALRAIARKMQMANFVDIAKRWAAVAGRPTYRFESVGRGHRAGQARLRRHRLSAERLATFMLRHLYPDLTLHCILQHWYPWRERFESLDGTVGGKQVWPLIEWILSTLWTGRANAERVIDEAGVTVPNHIIIWQDGQPVCKIAAESTLDFFFLGRDEAIAVVETWHHFRGILGYLSACPDQPEFQRVLDIRNRLGRGLAELTIRAGSTTVSPPVVRESDAQVPLTHESEFNVAIRQWGDCLSEYIRRLGIDPGARFGLLLSRVQSGFTAGSEGFGIWVCHLQELLRICPRLPAAPEKSGSVPAELLYDYVRIRADVAAELVEPAYQCLERFDSEYVGGRGRASPTYDRIQARIADGLLHHFSKTLRAQITNDAWMAGLIENAWDGEIPQLLQRQVDRFEELHARARSRGEERKLFRMTAYADLAGVRNNLTLVIDTPSSDRVWELLQEFCQAVYKVTCEAIEEDLCPMSPPVGHSQPRSWKRGEVRKASLSTLPKSEKRSLTLLEELRHRAAHGASPERRGEWVEIQKRTAEFLGRSWKPRSGSKNDPTYHANDDLVLTAHEGTMMKVILLRGVNTWLTQLVETHWWRPGNAAGLQ